MNHEAHTRDTLPPRKPTPRQLEVLAAYLRHGTYKAAAYELGIAENTVKQTALDIHERLDVQTTVQAIWALRRLLEPLMAAES